jgi:serine/threonine-protein kinase
VLPTGVIKENNIVSAIYEGVLRKSMTGVSGSNHSLPENIGRYQIVRELARSNDIVYEAIDPAMNRRIAIKELSLPSEIDPDQKQERLERFFREAKAAGALNHPNIVTIYEIGQEGERHFIAMEYLDGPSLREYLTTNGSIPLKLALQIGIDLADALGYAHSMGVIHRDVKPDNVHLVPPGHTAKLTDFGIAHVNDDMTASGSKQVYGTPSYMSPEQLIGKNVDSRTDIFSLGVLLYEIIFGKKPFVGDGMQGVMTAIMHSPVTFPPGVSAGVTGILRKALAKDPTQRYPSAQAMLGAIRDEMTYIDSPYSQSPIAAPRPPRAVKSATTNVGEQPTENAAAPAPSPKAEEKTEPPVSVTIFKRGETTFDPQPTSSGKSAINNNDDEPIVVSSDSVFSRFLESSLGATIGIILGVVAVISVLVWGGIFAVGFVGTLKQRNEATSYYKAADKAEESRDFPTAISYLQKTIKASPPGDSLISDSQRKLCDVYVKLGDSDALSNNNAKATSDYENALDSDSNNPNLYYKIGTVIPDVNQSLRYFDRAIALDKSGAVAQKAKLAKAQKYFKMATDELAKPDNKAAHDHFTQVIILAPTDPLADKAKEAIANMPR